MNAPLLSTEAHPLSHLRCVLVWHRHHTLDTRGLKHLVFAFFKVVSPEAAGLRLCRRGGAHKLGRVVLCKFASRNVSFEQVVQLLQCPSFGLWDEEEDKKPSTRRLSSDVPLAYSRTTYAQALKPIQTNPIFPPRLPYSAPWTETSSEWPYGG